MKLTYHDIFGYNDEWLYEDGNGCFVVFLTLLPFFVYGLILWIIEFASRAIEKHGTDQEKQSDDTSEEE